MSNIEGTIFLARDKNGYLVATLPAILDELRGKVERLQKRYDATDARIEWCLLEVAALYANRIVSREILRNGTELL